MHASLADFFHDAKPLLEAFRIWTERFTPPAHADHLCYKCGDHQEFVTLRDLFEKESSFLYQSIIAGRPIALIKFLQPFETPLGPINYLELSDQKPDGSQTSGFEHIEIYPTSGEIDALATHLTEKGFDLQKVTRPHHTTYDGMLDDLYKIRLESEALVDKIKLTEMF